MNRLWTVARFEFTTNVRRWEFLLLTLGLPLFSGLIIVLTSIPNVLYLQNKMNKPQITRVAVVDLTRSFKVPDEVPSSEAPPQIRLADPLSLTPEGHSSFRFMVYASDQEARKDLLAGKLDSIYVIHDDYMKTGDIDVVVVSKGFFHSDRSPPMRTILLDNMLHGKLDEALLKRVQEPMVTHKVMLSTTGQIIDSQLRQDVSDFFLPYGMMMLLMLSLVGSSSYLLRSVSEEKENRIMEILLSAVSPAALFYGKILGLGLLGLVQVVFWLVLSLPILGVILNFIHVTAAGLALFLIYFILGYMLHAGIIAGVGAIGSTEKESNQITSLFFLLSISPMMVMPIILDDVGGIVARLFSMFPFTAPIVMMVRLMREAPPITDIAISLGILVVSILIAYRISLQVFRMGLLLYGKTPSLKEIVIWLRQT